MKEFIKFITDLGKELAPVLLPEIARQIFRTDKVNHADIVTDLFDKILESDATLEAKKEAQRQVMDIAWLIFEHHGGNDA